MTDQMIENDMSGHQLLRHNMTANSLCLCHHDLLLQCGRLRHDLVLDLDPGLPACLPGPPHPLHPAGHRPGQLRSASAHWYCGQEGNYCLNVFPSRIYLCQCFLGLLGPLEQSLSVRPSVELNENTNNTCIPTTALYSIILYSTIWYSTVLYGTVLCCMVQYSTAY